MFVITQPVVRFPFEIWYNGHIAHVEMLGKVTLNFPCPNESQEH